MSDSNKQQEMKEIDIASLDSELAAAKTLEEGKGDLFIKIAAVFAFCMTSFHIFTGFHGLYDYVTQRGIHLAFALTLILLTQPLYKHVFKDKFAGSQVFRAVCRVIDIALIILAWVSVIFAMDEVHHLTERLSKTTWKAYFAGAVLALIVLECARRTLGYIMPILALIFVAYALAGPNLPYAIAHRGYSIERICKFLATDLDGLFGTTMSVSASVIFMFVMFGAFLEASGCSDFINKIAISLTGKIKSGPALSAVVASGLMGSINGSAVANVVGTGTFTIPLMKSRGYKPQFAGGVESVASTGGQILPPVMGSGAFLMVAFTEQKYIAIVIAAVIPALLYYWGCAVAVITQSELIEISMMDEKDIPKTKEVLKDGWIYLLILGILITALLVIQLSPLYSALWATCSVPIIHPVRHGEIRILGHVHRHRLRLRRHRRRHGLPDRYRRYLRRHDDPAGTLHAVPVPGVHGGHLHHPRHGPSDHRSIRHRGFHPGAVPDQARPDPADLASVCLLLRMPVRHHAAGRTGCLCRCRYCEVQSDDYRSGSMQTRLRGLHRPLCFLLQPGHDDAGNGSRDPVGLPDRLYRNRSHLRRIPGLAVLAAEYH